MSFIWPNDGSSKYFAGLIANIESGLYSLPPTLMEDVLEKKDSLGQN